MLQSAVRRTAIAALIRQHGRQYRSDISTGVNACARVWVLHREGQAAFADFCLAHYVPPGPKKEALLRRLDHLWGEIQGGVTMFTKCARVGLDLEEREITPTEQLLGAFTTGSHLEEDYRAFRIAPLVQLNFGTIRRDIPATRAGWAARRLAKWGRTAVPARLTAAAHKVESEVDAFITGYNLHLDRISFLDPTVRFPDGTRLISHWGLRDCLSACYGESGGLAKQRAIMGLLRQVVDGKVPETMIDNPAASWDQASGTITVDGVARRARGHGSLRMRQFRSLFHARRAIDPYRWEGNFLTETFEEERELPEVRVRALLTAILRAPVAARVGNVLANLLGRALEPFDIYCRRFAAGASAPLSNLMVAKRYPDAASLQRALPDILSRLGFAKELAGWISGKIRVEASRSAGHAWPPGAHYDIQLLRVRLSPSGVTYREFVTFMHELGHCVEGVLSSYRMDYRVLWGVPNSAISEAFAFIFQDRAAFALGEEDKPATPETALQHFWDAFEIAGSALVELDFVHWCYRHKGAGAAQMQCALRAIADRIWAKHYARILGRDGHGLLAVYSHMLWCELYLSNYPIGLICAHQLRHFLNDKSLGGELPRICAVGKIYPDAWMREALGRPIDAAPLIADATSALEVVSKPRFRAAPLAGLN